MMGISKGRSVSISPRSGIGSSSKMSKVGEIEAKHGVLGSKDVSVEDIAEADQKRDPLESLQADRKKELLDKYSTDTDLRDVAPEDREDYSRLLNNNTKQLEPHQIAARAIRNRAEDSTKVERQTTDLRGKLAQDVKPDSLVSDGGSPFGFDSEGKAVYRGMDIGRRLGGQSRLGLDDLDEQKRLGMSPEELRNRLQTVRDARSKAREAGQTLSADEQRAIFDKAKPAEVKPQVDKKQAKLDKQVAELKRRTAKNSGADAEPIEDDALRADIDKHRRLFERQQQLSAEQRQQEYPTPIKPLDQYKTAQELHHAMSMYLTKEEQEELRQNKITEGGGRDNISSFEGQDGAKYEVFKVTNKEALSELAQGSNWCVKDEDTALSYLEKSHDGAFFVLQKDGKPLAAIREDNKTGKSEAWYYTDFDIATGTNYAHEEDDKQQWILEQDFNAIKDVYQELGRGVLSDQYVHTYESEEALDGILNNIADGLLKNETEYTASDVHKIIKSTRHNISAKTMQRLFEAVSQTGRNAAGDDDGLDAVRSLALAYAESRRSRVDQFSFKVTPSAPDINIEAILAESPSAAVMYGQVLGGRFPAGEYRDKAEEAISRNLINAIKYAAHLKSRFPGKFREQAENSILDGIVNPNKADSFETNLTEDYMKAAGMSRWPAYEARLEKAMAAGGDARHQAVSLIHRYLMTADWEQGERALALEGPSYLADLAIKRGYNLGCRAGNLPILMGR